MNKKIYSPHKYPKHKKHLKKHFTIVVDNNESGNRLDTIVSSHISDCSRSLLSKLIRKGLIKVRGTVKKPGYPVKTGDEIHGIIPDEKLTLYEAEPLGIDIIFEDNDIIVLNKQAGIVVHPAPGHYTGTLLNRLIYHCPDLKEIGEDLRYGIVHRLDKDTSGALIVAKNRISHNNLTSQFKSRIIKKTYLTLVHGIFDSDSGTISLPIGRHPVNRKKMSIVTQKGRSAETIWKVSKSFNNITLLEIDLKTGRTHQIRVHFAAVNHPVAGDPVYGRGRRIKNIKISRQMLHAWRLEFTHPVSQKTMSFEAPVPADMSNVIKELTETTLMN
jgi:23S rRNA pseudouridine1911/1915/1917 synthase